MRFGFPPKLQEQETAQLQLSATVAVICQSGAVVVCCEAGLARRATPEEISATRVAVIARLDGRNGRTLDLREEGYH
jgi:hypothetical protein